MSTQMIIAIGADHRGFAAKEIIKSSFLRYTFIDVGTDSNARTDYPLFAHGVAEHVTSDRATHGILLCGSGIGMAIVANRYPGIYAGVVWNEKVAWQAKAHDNVNVLVLACDYIDIEKNNIITIIKTWLDTEFKGERYAMRIALIDNFEV